MTFVGRRVGSPPVGCCRSLPCSLIKVGARLESLVRSWGMIFDLIRGLMSALEAVSSIMLMSNCGRKKSVSREVK